MKFDTVKAKLSECLNALPACGDGSRRMLDFRIGLTDGYPRTVEEVARLFDVSPESAENTMDAALKWLERTDFHILLKEYVGLLKNGAGIEASNLIGDVHDFDGDDLVEEPRNENVNNIIEAFGEVMDFFCKFPFFAQMIARELDKVEAGEIPVGRITLKGVDGKSYFERVPAMRKAVLDAGKRMIREKKCQKEARREFWEALRKMRPNAETILRLVDEAKERLYRPCKALAREGAAILAMKSSPDKDARRKKLKEHKDAMDSALGMNGGNFLLEFRKLLKATERLKSVCGYKEAERCISAAELFND